jgi:predicted esterase
VLGALAFSPSASAEPGWHVVSSGDTLGGIARKYDTSVTQLCEENGIRRDKPIRIGQRLRIPSKATSSSTVPASNVANRSDEPKTTASNDKPSNDKPGSDALQHFAVPGGSVAYYYEPTGPGRKSLKPVLMYLHGRGGDPAGDCQRWAKVARPLGWVVCPAGQAAYGSGRTWENDWSQARGVVMSTLNELRRLYGRRVQLYGNTLIGFSEGAYAAMNIGVREPKTFNRWLILAADSHYWGSFGPELLGNASTRLKRVYLITGEHDGVVDSTRQVRNLLRRANISTKISIPGDLAHEVDLDDRSGLYRMALVWLDGAA